MKSWAWALLGLGLLAILLRSAPLFLLTLLLTLIAGAALLWLRVCLVGVSYQRRFSMPSRCHSPGCAPRTNCPKP